MEDCCIISTSFPLSEEDFCFFFLFLYAQTRFKVTPLAIVYLSKKKLHLLLLYFVIFFFCLVFLFVFLCV
jgi:hypothetical protein